MKKVILISLMLYFVILGLLITGAFFVRKQVRHDYKYKVFRRIARNLTVNMDNDYHKALNIAYHVFDRVRPNLPGAVMPAIDDNFLNIYTRGFGYCDQSSYCLVMMLSSAGIDARMLMLKDERGVSPHTVATFKANGRWYIADTTFRHIFPYDRLRSEEFREYLGVVRRTYPSMDYRPEHFEDGVRWDIGREVREKYRRQ